MLMMIARTGPNLPVPTTSRASRVERAGRADVRTGGEAHRHAAPPATPSRERRRDTGREAPAAEASRAAETWLSLNAGPRPRGLRADECERRRYRAAYQRASEPAPAAAAPRLERSA